MNTQEILKDLKQVSCRENIRHATALNGIYEFLKTITIESFTIEDSKVMFGRETEKTFKWGSDEYTIQVRREGEEMPAKKIIIKSGNGVYTVTCPIGELCNRFLELVGIKQEVKMWNITDAIVLQDDIAQHIKKAATFQEMDIKGNPRLQGILIEIKAGEVKVIGCDGHKMYFSNSTGIIEHDGIDRELHLVGDFSKINRACQINILESGNVLIGGVELYLSDVEYVKWETVVPELTKSIVCDKKQLQKGIKQVAPYTNKYSNIIAMYMNGLVQLSGEDVDFEQEMVTSFMYKSKDFEDCTIGFNHKLLSHCLKNIDGNDFKMRTDGIPSHAVLIDNQDSTMLLMPFIINH